MLNLAQYGYAVVARAPATEQDVERNWKSLLENSVKAKLKNFMCHTSMHNANSIDVDCMKDHITVVVSGLFNPSKSTIDVRAEVTFKEDQFDAGTILTNDSETFDLDSAKDHASFIEIVEQVLQTATQDSREALEAMQRRISDALHIINV